jgi:hypothetical protein
VSADEEVWTIEVPENASAAEFEAALQTVVNQRMDTDLDSVLKPFK